MYLLFIFWSKRDEKPNFIIFWLKDPWDIAVPKKKQSLLVILCPPPPRKILSPPKQLLKIHFYFMLTALLKLENVSEGFGCQCYLFPNSHLAPQGLFPPLPKWTPQKVVMDLAIWERWCHLWNSTWHLQPSLPTCELPAQWVLGKWNGLNNYPGRRGIDWQVKFGSRMYYLQLNPVINWISLSCTFRHKGTDAKGGYLL